MSDILLGIFGFVFIHLSDYTFLTKIPLFKPSVWVIGCGVLGYALFNICSNPDKFLFPLWVTGLGWVLLIISIFLLLYSLFINLPFKKTYVAKGVGSKLIKTGLYSIVRHPGVPSFVILMIALFLVSGSRQLIVAGPLYILVDIVLVILQDKIFFPKMFPEYHVYRQETPMLFPNRRSIRTFFASFKQVRTKNGKKVEKISYIH